MLHINVANVIFGGRNQLDCLPEIEFSLPVDSISIRDLIARTVELQIAELLDKQAQSNAQAKAMLERQYIDDETMAEQARSGKIALAKAKLSAEQSIDVEHEIKRATKAFTAGRYKIFINGRDFTELDDCISYSEAVNVKFMRIMPLVGG